MGGRVNNNGPRTIRLNTIKDENWVGNTDIRSGNYYGLGTLAQDAITIETNISVGGTDSSTYTQQVELSNLKFSKSGRPVTISNDPNQTTEGIHNGIYYTTDLKNIVNEVNVQRTNALNILNNRDKYEAIVSECDNIFKTIEGMIAPQAPAQAYKPEELETFKREIDTRLSTQENLLLQIAQELGLNNKEKKDGKKS